MRNNTLHLIYFSPTGTTRKIIDAVAHGFSAEQIERYDLTYNFEKSKQRIEDGVAIIGIPVYAGRVPEACLERMTNYIANDVPTVLIALYGNREFEDALVELRDLSSARGFNVIAAGAFIGEHSYSTVERPIAAGRPDADDLEIAIEFGNTVARKIEINGLSTPEIAGKIPYRERVTFGGVAPETDSNTCTLCGKCAESCPVDVIKVSSSVVTEAENCIMCCACLRACTVEARLFKHPRVEEKRELLAKHCSTPKRPQLFL